jgi:predicted DNA-binding transcriptional regulator AlpA
MPPKPKSPKIVAEMPPHLCDDQVLTEPQVCVLVGFSQDTLQRLRQRGEGPRRVQISDRRHGYTLREVRRWLDARSVA